MDVKTLCLGLLSFREACGYELKKEFETTFKHFFPAGYGSIYPALADLAAAGLVRCREVPQAGKPDRKVYRITDEGRRFFAESLQNSNPQHRLRSEFLAMIYFADVMEPGRLQALLDDRVAELHESIDHLEALEAQWDRNTPAGARFVNGFGTALAKAAADYIESQRDMLGRKYRGRRRRSDDRAGDRV